MRRPLALALLVSVLASCVNQPGVAPGPGGSAFPGASPSPTPAPLTALPTYGPMTAEHQALLSAYVPFAERLDVKAPKGDHLQVPRYPGVVSGNLNLNLDYATFGGDAFSPTFQSRLTSLEVATTQGAWGTYRQVYEAVVRPLIAELGPTPTLVRSSLRSTEAPGAVDIDGGYGTEPWVLTYAGLSKLAVIHLHITPQKTTVFRLTWAGYADQVQGGLISREAAIQKLEQAIRTAGFKGVEEESGKDYFLDLPFTAETKPAETEYGPVYEIPAGARWEARLVGTKDKLAWSLRTPVTARVEAAYPTTAYRTMSTQAPGYYVPVRRDRAFGLVDAKTGAVIRFQRPYIEPQWQTGSRPTASPSPSPSPSAAASVSPSPTASVSP